MTLTYEDVGQILIATYYYATGMSNEALPDPSEIDYSSFVSIADKTLQLGTEQVMNALTMVLSKTIFAERPYDAKFRSLELDSIEWGNIVRKINFADGGSLSPETTYDPDMGDGEHFDRFVVGDDQGDSYKSPWFGKDAAVVQTNFYGTAVASDSYQIREEALKGAFRGPEELAAFINALITFINNRHEQFIETLARGALANYILGKVATAQAETDNGATLDKFHVIHLLSEYNTETGLSLTTTTVYQPDNFKPFMAWVYGKVASISDMMTERTNLFHTDLVKEDYFGSGSKLYVLRHTPKRDQKIILYSPIQHMSAARALADTYHDSYLRYADVELVNYFGNISDPQTVTGTYSYLSTSGNGEVIYGPYISDEGGEDEQTIDTVSNIFGLILDRNTVGYMRQNTRVLTSPYNPATQSYTLWWHLAGKWVNDFSENGCLLLLD